MKLSQLTPEQKTRLLAELDGLEFHYSGDGYCIRKGEPTYHLPPLYLTSYDAIIPLVHSYCRVNQLRNKFIIALAAIVMPEEEDLQDILTIKNGWHLLAATPSQLCDAVLIATGKAEL